MYITFILSWFIDLIKLNLSSVSFISGGLMAGFLGVPPFLYHSSHGITDHFDILTIAYTSLTEILQL